MIKFFYKKENVVEWHENKRNIVDFWYLWEEEEEEGGMIRGR